MLKDIVPNFADIVKNNPQFVLDNYELKEGLYIKLPIQKHFSAIQDQDFLVISKRKEKEEFISKRSLLDWFKKRDFYSSVLNDDSNKVVDFPARKIWSTNYLTLFLKVKFFEEGTDKIPDDKLKEHFLYFLQVLLPKSQERLLDPYPIIASKKAERERQIEARHEFFQQNYSELMDYLLSTERKENQEAVLQFWDNSFDEVLYSVRELVEEYKINNYIKVFFDVDEEEYQKEYEAYILPRIFNVNKYNQLIDGNIVGLPAYDVSMNTKKPFFELKTMKTKVPTRVSLEEALSIKDFYGWLEKQGKFKEISIPFHEPFGPGTGTEFERDTAKGAYYLSLDKNGGIVHYENTPFQPRETWSLPIENVLAIQEKEDDIWRAKVYHPPISGKGQLRHEISRLFFGNCLPNNLLESKAPEVKEGIFTAEMVSVYVMVRQALFDFLVKDTDDTIGLFIQKYSMLLIENQLLKTVKGVSFQKLADAFHLRLALLTKLDYKEGTYLSDIIRKIYAGLQEKLFQKNELSVCESDQEFFFLAGQVGYYLLSQSESAKKTLGLAEPILKAKNPQVLKNRLIDLLEAYSHAIQLNFVAFKNAFAMVQGYETKARLEGTNKQILIAGLLAANLFYQKKENEGGSKE